MGCKGVIKISPLLLQHGVEGTAEACRKLGATAYAITVDCSNREEIYSAAEKVRIAVNETQKFS